MEIFAVFGLICFVPLLIVGSTIWRGYVGTKLWLWFVVPQFGCAPLPINTAIGLSVLIGLYSHYSPDPKDKERTNGEALCAAIAKDTMIPALGLLMGWIVLQCR